MPSGETAMREMLEELSHGNVVVWDLMRSVTEILLPTGVIRSEFSEMIAFPPLYGAPRRFWNL